MNSTKVNKYIFELVSGDPDIVTENSIYGASAIMEVNTNQLTNFAMTVGYNDYNTLKRYMKQTKRLKSTNVFSVYKNINEVYERIQRLSNREINSNIIINLIQGIYYIKFEAESIENCTLAKKIAIKLDKILLSFKERNYKLNDSATILELKQIVEIELSDILYLQF